MKAGNLQLRRTFRRVELKTFWLGAVLALVSMVAPSTMFAQTIRTIAGTGTGGYTGDNGAATTANIAAPYGLATDNAGNIYLPTSGFSIVRKVDISGVITTIAGTGVSGYSGDGGAATNAQFNQPIAAAVDNSGNIYIGDEGGHVVRKIDNSGIITTVAGDGTLGSTGDGGAATNAQLSQVLDVSVDNAGNIYIADQTNKVRMVNTSGIISTFAGTGGSGYTGDNGPATAATLNYVTRVSPDNMGNVYIVDAGNNVVRKVDNLGNITTFAGTGGIGYTGDGGPATAATFSGGIGDVEINRFTGEVYISDANNNVIRKVNGSGNISTIAGNGTAGYSGDGGAATSAQLNSPHNIDFDLNGNLIVGDYANYVVRLVTANNPPSFDNGTVQSLTVCSNTAPTDINSMLAASDADAGQTETWSLSSAPANGTVAVDYSATSTGGSITPTGLTYQPNTGFSGTDAFTVMIDDGNGGTATTTINVTVNPTPDVTVTNGDQSVCNNNATLAITFTGSVSGTSYDWMNSDPSIGIGASGNGDILSFNATNSDPALPVVAVLTVTPSYLGCVGTPQIFTITVNPTPSVSPMSNQAYCNGETAGPFNFSGPVAGTTFTWTNSDNTIGLASLGAGDIGTFTATNATTDPVSAVIQVNSSANGCTGTSNSFTIVVNPTPMLSSSATPPDVCDGTMFSYTPITSATGGTPFFDWSRATVAGISNAAATGSDDPAEVLVNTTPNPVAVTYVYTLSVNSCTNVQSVTVNVNPTPMLSGTLTPPAICDSTAFVYKDTSLTAGTTYAWDRAVVAGISNIAGSGTGDINETLENTTTDPIVVTYTITLTANGCTNTQTVPVTVNPKPMLNSATTLATICDGSHVFYMATSLTTGTTFVWNRGNVTGLSNPPASGADSISETLHSTSTAPVAVTYVYTLTANGCSNTQSVSLTVNPTPVLTSTLTPQAICNGDMFNYTPASATTGTTFAWTRSFVVGIGLAAGSGSGNPFEQLINNTNDRLGVVYTYTLTANGCTHTQNVTVTVNPTPTLSSGQSYRVCSGTNFHYVATGFVFGTTFAWTRVHMAGIAPANGSGTTGTIDEVLTDSLMTPIGTTYVFTLLANGCSHVQPIAVTVDPTPPAGNITTAPPHELCSNTMYQNFGSNTPPAGQDYHWSATNATVWATGAHGQYALVNFTTPGTATVTLISNLTGSRCVTNNAYMVNVGSAMSDAPQVYYFNGQLICMQADEDSYQWGFDDDVTLDSTIIEGEKNPNYFISGPDFSRRHYWVITRRGDCMQKSYYNAPTGITNVNADRSEMTLYPNPAKEYVNVAINTSAAGNFEVQVYNMMGQSVAATGMNDHKATVNLAGLPSGVYLVDCYNNGVKVATQKFIKN